jgi:hypothetical protein
MRSSAASAGGTAYANDYNNLRDDAYGGSMLIPHQQSVPGMAVTVEAGILYLGPTQVIFAGGDSPTITAPTGNPRIDLLTIDNAGTLALITGTEASSPTAPTYPTDKMVLAEIYNVVGETIIYDNANQTAGQGYITDVRPFLSNVNPSSAVLGTPLLDHEYTNDSGRAQLHIVTVDMIVGDSSGSAGFITLTATVSGVSSAPEVKCRTLSAKEIEMEMVLTFFVPNGNTYKIVSYTGGVFTTPTVVDWQIITL